MAEEKKLNVAKEQREKIIRNIADDLRRMPFTFEYVVRKKPKGIKVIYEVTQEQIDRIIAYAERKEKGNDNENKKKELWQKIKK